MPLRQDSSGQSYCPCRATKAEPLGVVGRVPVGYMQLVKLDPITCECVGPELGEAQLWLDRPSKRPR